MLNFKERWGMLVPLSTASAWEVDNDAPEIWDNEHPTFATPWQWVDEAHGRVAYLEFWLC